LSLFKEALVVFVLGDEFACIFLEIFFIEYDWEVVDDPLTFIVKEVILDSLER
jgi:hypothetical protein